MVNRKSDAAVVCVDKLKSALNGKKLGVVIDVIGVERVKAVFVKTDAVELISVVVEIVAAVRVVVVEGCGVVVVVRVLWKAAG